MDIIRNIEIQNFKSIRHVSIENCRRINLFVGYPNVGKSNILEALSIFGLNGQINLKDLIRLKEIPTIFFNGFIGNDLLVSLNDEYGVVGFFAENSFIFQFQDGEGSAPFQKIRLNSNLNIAAKESYIFKDNFITAGIQVPPNRKIRQYAVVRKYDFEKERNEKFRNYSFLEYPFGENIFSILQTNEQLRKDAKELFGEYDLEFLYDSREQEFTILKRTDSGIFTVPYELVADTLQRLIFFKAAIYSNQGSVLLFEEPEAHMFPPYISKFTSDIWHYKDNQYFISTQSPFVVNDFLENTKGELAIYVVEYKKQSGETIVKRLTEEQMHEAYQYGIDVFFNLESITK